MLLIEDNGNDPQVFVYKTDVHSYYQSIQHHILLDQLRQQGLAPSLLTLVWNYLTRLIDINAHLLQVRQGIPKGCSLSPVLSALYLSRLDQLMQHHMDRLESANGKIFYGRFQDDWVILATNRWTLKRAIRAQHKILQELKLDLRPEKTFIGYATKGFDFLEYRIQQVQPGLTKAKTRDTDAKNPNLHCKPKTASPSKLVANKDTPKLSSLNKQSTETAPMVTVALSKTTLERFQKKRTRLYEQKASPERLGAYARRFEQWARAGIPNYYSGCFTSVLSDSSFCRIPMTDHAE